MSSWISRSAKKNLTLTLRKQALPSGILPGSPRPISARLTIETNKALIDMNIAIIAAMQKELDLLRPLLADAVEFCTTDYACRGWRGRIGRHRVNIVKCGIGKVNAALRTQSLLRAATPDVVINTGVAGGTGAAGILGSRPTRGSPHSPV